MNAKDVGDTRATAGSKINAVLKFVCIVCLVAFLPRIISHTEQQTEDDTIKNQSILLGIENLITSPTPFGINKTLNLALIVNHSSIDQQNNRSIDILLKHDYSVKKIFFVPDIRSRITHAIDNATKLPLISVPTKKFDTLSTADLKNFDAFVVDIQETGITSNVSSKLLAALFPFAAKHHKKIIILDRPNPLGGVIEGPGTIPLRHGMTIGELAHYYNKYVLPDPIALTVVPLLRWRRNQTNLPIVTHMQTQNVLELLAKVKPIHLESDINKTFHLVLLPENQRLSPWETRYFKKICRQLGFYCRDHDTYDEQQKIKFAGIKAHVKQDIEKFSAFNSFLALTRFLNNRKNITLTFSRSFDRQMGDEDVRKYLHGYMRFDDLKEKIGKSITLFYNQARNCFLYKPHPKIINPELIKV